MHLTGIKLGGIPPFTEPITLRFDERVNVFIGPNASGKSMLLETLLDRFAMFREGKKAIAGGSVFTRLKLCTNEDFCELVNEDVPEDEVRNLLSVSEDWASTKNKPNLYENNPPVVSIGSVREVLPGITGIETDAYGDKSDTVLNYATTFSGPRTVCATELLMRELWSDDTESPLEARFVLLEAIESANACCKRICDEVLVDSRAQDYISEWDIRGYMQHPVPEGVLKTPIQRLMGINTIDARNFDNYFLGDRPSYPTYGENLDSIPIHISHLSSGTEGTLLWIRWLTLKMVQHYKFEQGWHQKPAILLIDEVENHLHPTWQRRVIPALLEYFPELQIFATTHSPFVVAGLKAGQVHKLDRDANGVVKATTEARDVIGWTMDEILRGMMGVDDPTDAETARAAAELRQLRSGEPKTDEKEEELRQQRIQELRSVVDRDLLAGGPVAAQRELFERNLAEILEEHRKAQGLNQD